MPANTYRLKINRQGFEFEAEGDKAFVLDMLKRFESGGGDPNAPNGGSTGGKKEKPRRDEKPTVDSAERSGKTLSIREFVQALSLKKHTDITLAFGYYLEKYSDVPAFTPADINNCYYEAKLDTSNTSQMITQNIKRGYMMPSQKKGEKDKKKLYTLTSSGERFIDSKLAANA
ncbi:MAG: hypothetical protein WA823_13355 [Candidatus Acidiferrales bacterium]